jgi:cytochrome c553
MMGYSEKKPTHRSPVTRLSGSLALTLSVLFLMAASPIAAAQTKSSMPPLQDVERAALFPSSSEIALGRSLAETSCAHCHGLDGITPNKELPNLAGQRTIYLYRVLKAYRDGDRGDESMQQSVAFLSDDALLKVAIYFASLAPAPSADVTGPDLTDADPFVAVREATVGCARCHGETGNSSKPGMPNLTSQHPDVFVSAMLAYKEGGRAHRMMQRLVAALDIEMIEDMAVFYALQEPLPTTTPPVSGDAHAGESEAVACGACHGPDGNASSPGTPSIAGQDPRYFSKAMKAYQDGERDHVPMTSAVAGLSEAVINDLATFYAQQQPVDRNVHRPLTTGEWVQRCNRCHGISGNSTDPRYSALAGQNPVYLEKALRAYAENGNGHSLMHAMTEPLSKIDIERIVAHYAAQQPKSVLYVDIPCQNSAKE